MKHNWEYRPFRQLADTLYGYPFESDFFNSESKGMPLIRIRDVKPGSTSTFFAGSYLDEYIIKRGEYLIGMDGEFNIAPWQSNDALLNQRVCRVKSLDEKTLLSDFIFYFLSRELKHIEDRTSFVTVKHLSAKVLNSINTPVPPIEVQEQIVAELDKINEVIADCQELLRKLNTLAQSLFYTTFGDPITNPKAWNFDKLGNLLIIERGGSPRPIKDYITQDEDGINWIKIGDANSSMYISSTKEKIKPSGKSKSRFVKPGDFILSNSMSFGRPYIMNTYGCIHDGWLLLRDENNIYNKIFLYYCLNSKSIYTEFERLVRTGTVSNLNSDIVRGVKVPVPPLALQEQFAARIEAIEKQKATVEQTIAKMRTLLNSRMDHWFN